MEATHLSFPQALTQLLGRRRVSMKDAEHLCNSDKLVADGVFDGTEGRAGLVCNSQEFT